MFKQADHVIYFVHDLERAKAFYTETLERPLIMDVPGFAGVDLGNIWLGLHPTEANGQDIGRGPMLYLAVDDIQAALTTLRERGVDVVHEARDVGVGQIATFSDSEGNALGLYQKA